MTKIGPPNLNDAPSWYRHFLNLATGDDLIEALESNKRQVTQLMASVPQSKEDFRYAEGKWTTKQVFIHLADEERYYAYKAFCYSRQVDVFLEMPQGDDYNRGLNSAQRTLKDIGEEFVTVRNATISLFRTMTDAMLDFKDFPNQQEVYTARSLGWFAVGHNIHHCNLITSKYL